VLLGQLADQRAHLEPLDRVEAGGRLVEDQHLRARQQRHRQARALAQAPGQAAHLGARAVGQAHALEGRADGLLAVPAGQAVQARLELQHLLHPVLAVQRHVLGEVADALAHLHGLAHHVEARHLDAPLGGREVAGQDAHGGGLPGAVRPQEPHDFTAVQVEAEIFDRGARSEATGQAFDVDHGGEQ
jgi:hypothetical protein